MLLLKGHLFGQAVHTVLQLLSQLAGLGSLSLQVHSSDLLQ